MRNYQTSAMINPEKFKAARKASSLTQKQLAEKVGVAYQLIGQIERGEGLSSKYIFSFARHMGVPAYELDDDVPRDAAITGARPEIVDFVRRLSDVPDDDLPDVIDHLNTTLKFVRKGRKVELKP